MNRWAWIITGVASLGLGGWLATGLQGRFGGVGTDPASLALHTEAGLVSTLAMLLANLWFVVFLGVTARSARRADPQGGPSSALVRSARPALVAGTAASLLVVAQPALAGLSYPDRMSPLVHLLLALAGLVVECVFLAFAIRAVAAQGRAFAQLEEPGRAGA